MTIDEIRSFRAKNGYTAFFNLRDANLYFADLSFTNLRDANLRDANLYGADLRFVSLYDANLRGANLEDADLYGADLYGADLSLADLRDANLRRANLCFTNLYGANLEGANLEDADLYSANLYGADLRGGLGIYIPNIVDPRGYSPFIQYINGEFRFISGCRNFTIEEAKRHWGESYRGKQHIGNRYLEGIKQLDGSEFKEWREKERKRFE